MISKERFEAMCACEEKINGYFIEAAYRVKEILTKHKCDGKVFNKRIVDIVANELKMPQFINVLKNRGSYGTFLSLYLNNNERHYDNGNGINGYIGHGGVLALDIIVDEQSCRIKLKETLDLIDCEINRLKKNNSTLEQYIENYDIYKYYEDKLIRVYEEYINNVPRRLRNIVAKEIINSK